MSQFNLYESAGFTLVNTAFQVKQNLTALFLKHGFDATVDQFSVLAALSREDGVTQKRLSEISGKTDSNLTRILKGMEHKGLLYRRIGSDARNRTVHLSKTGTELYGALLPIAREYNARIFRGISKEETETLSRILRQLRAGLSPER
ncbi:MarR family winged helix-turn-helix transcriptional regulator [Breznakiella homolactica]|uniref:Winged helix-turn-helix transcriptional regulator n=1 Tax=Breznakiella homolactica TaxID=2798577 RepID=A0A7T7XLJ7_9SPIR|nr:MarR family winged helix-turn-helix transcriptional regulator [Breznakiella homolactica]QQO08639.1 MarR family winged helix-turn-helix transcriptional regulator [Breznakiella homolactica]